MLKCAGWGLVVKRPGVLSKVQILNLVLGVGVFSLLPILGAFPGTLVLTKGYRVGSELLGIRQEKRSTNPNLWFWMSSSGVGVMHVKGWGPKRSASPSNPQETKPFGGISRNFCWDIPGVSEKFENRKTPVFNVWPPGKRLSEPLGKSNGPKWDMRMTGLMVNLSRCEPLSCSEQRLTASSIVADEIVCFEGFARHGCSLTLKRLSLAHKAHS